MDKQKINIAIVGCGRISKSHINAISNELNRCSLVAICDNSVKNLEETHDYAMNVFRDKNIKIDIAKFNNYQKLLDSHQEKKIKLDLIIIATPSGLHAEQTIQAANHFINVCTEKPMALNISDANKMINKCDAKKVKLFVVKQNRLNPTLKELNSKIKAGKFGKIGIVSLNVFWHRPQSYYEQGNWRGTNDMDGGTLMNQAIHYIDLLEWLIGPIESLSASVATISRDIECEDTAVLNFKWVQGTLGTMAVTMITYPKNLEGSITVIGDKGSAKVGGEALNKFEFSYFNKESNNDKCQESSYEIKNVYGSGHNAYYKNMLDVLVNNDSPICDGRDGLSSIKIIHAAYSSSKTSKKITLKS